MNYREKFYKYQTTARGKTDKLSLETHFSKIDKIYWSILKKFLPSDKNAICIDLPCGYGNFLYFLNKRGYKNVTGFDLDNEQVHLANLLNLPASFGDVFDVLNRTNSTKSDLISSFDFIEHIPKDDALDFLAKCFCNLNENGILIIRTPSADGPFGSHDSANDITHEWSMTSTVLETILKMSGFRKVTIIDEYPRPINFLGFLRWCVYIPSKLLAQLFCIGLGLRPPRVWSRSMIAVARK